MKEELNVFFPVPKADPAKFQCFKEIGVKFGVAIDSDSYRGAINKFRDYGIKQASAATTTVDTGIFDILNHL